MIEKNISTNENLVQDISNELIFGHTHNGVKCAVCPTAKRACDRAWFSAKQIEEWSEMSTMTLNRRLHDLEECERISRLSDLVNVTIQTETGAVKTTLYNLNVLNQLAMVEIKNKVLNDTAKKFSDILSEVETTGSYSVNQAQNHPVLPTTYLEALEALVASEKAKLALQMERDEAIRTKAMMGSRREATAMNTASQKSKEREKLREQIGDSKTYRAVTAITWLPDYFNMSIRGLYGSLAANLKKIEAGMTSEFKHIDIPDSRFGKVKAYHVDVIERLHEMVQADENLMAKYRKIASV